MKHKDKVRIGCGAGFSGDRIEPALVLAEKGDLDYLVLECLAERTIALAQKRKAANPAHGYDPLLERRIELLLPLLKKNKIRLITNMGAANPVAAADKIIDIAKKQGIAIKVAAVTGDDVLEHIGGDEIAMETGNPVSLSGPVISANAYLGADAILPALETGAEIIVTGRVADPSLFVAPLIYEFGWSLDDADIIARGTVTGHLLECAGQITGGYFADPVKKPVDNMATLGHPFADVYADGCASISKVDGTGGSITLSTAKEQLLYEVTNPYTYITPDVSADFTTVYLKQEGKDCIKVSGGSGRKKPSALKVSIGYKAGFTGEGEITYAGANALERASLAGDIIKQRLANKFPGIRVDYIGHTSVHPSSLSNGYQPYEVRLRISGRATTADEAAIIGEEVESLYTNGPAGGGGVRKYVNEVIGIVSVLIDRSKAKSSVILKSYEH
ncbi:acyclic terpene utilization AtuA family protein [Mucilaginibacter celer]|uniref:Acyclic terpene utilization AtuA family protein n=1 Tax=Mucilaginibacter celer TaxID=2305508 RepID=A0A494VPP6_9SPHI|nr:acyclic terpene utilization AtuA family protein [Mucilaginibacter celer]AYL95831.1 acyclic terpene utilization AtuA family protein [Mucilaginibacter celer]